MKPASIPKYLTSSELRYRKRFISVVYSVVLVTLTIRWFVVLKFTTAADSLEEIASQMELTVWITIAASALIAHGLFSGFRRQKRNRLLSAVPVSPRAVAWSRLLTLPLIHAIPLVFWIVVYFLLRSGALAQYNGAMRVATLPPRHYDIAVWTPVIALAISVIVCLFVALAHTWKKPIWGNILYWIGAVAITNVFIYPAGSSPELFLPGYSVFNTFWGVLYYCTIALILAGSVVFAHTRKRNYDD